MSVVKNKVIDVGNGILVALNARVSVLLAFIFVAAKGATFSVNLAGVACSFVNIDFICHLVALSVDGNSENIALADSGN